MTLRVLEPTQAPRAPSWLSRFFSVAEPGLVAAALRSLFGTDRTSDPTASDVSELLAAWGYETAHRSRPVREEVLADLIEAIIDPAVGYDAATTSKIDTVASTLSLEVSSVETTKKRAALELIDAAIDQALDDRIFRPDERRKISALAERTGVSSKELTDAVKRVVQPLVDDELRRALADGRYSPQEEADLKEFAAGLGANLEIDPGSTDTLARMRRIWLIENGVLPTLSAPIVLKKGETLHFSSPAIWSELRTRTKTIRYAGPTASIRIMRGLRYRIGSVSPIRETITELKPIAQGVLYVTNKRALIDGSAGNKSVQLSAIFGLEVFSDAVKLEKATGKDPYLQVPADRVEELALLLSTLLEGRGRVATKSGQ